MLNSWLIGFSYASQEVVNRKNIFMLYIQYALIQLLEISILCLNNTSCEA